MCDAAVAAAAAAGAGTMTGTGTGTVTGETVTMEEQQQQQQSCCRLCIAPASECISIINSYAADKEPLATKINNCVNIKITPSDRLSLYICHACISYLNSWQSFKNRCLSSQTKQRQWLDTDSSKQQALLGYLDLNRAENGSSAVDQQQQQQQTAVASKIDTAAAAAVAAVTAAEKVSANILDGIPSLKKRKSLTVYVSPKQQQQQQQLQLQQLTAAEPQQTLQTLLLQVPPATTSLLAATSSAQQQQQQQQQQQRKYQQQQQRGKHQQHYQQKQHQLQLLQQQQQTQQRRMRQPRRPQQQRLPKFKQKVYLPLDIKVPALPPLLPPPTGLSTVAVAAAAATSLPIDFTQQPNLNPNSNFNQSQSQLQLQRYGSVVPPLPPPLPPPPPPPVATIMSSSNVAVADGTVSASAAVATPLLMPVTLQSAAQQLRFFRRYSYNNPLPAVPIKDEPLDDTDDDFQMKSIDESDDMMDPTMFLERSEHEGDVPLTASDYDYTAQHGVTAVAAAATLPPNAVANVAAAGDSKVASCRACSLQFSTRANARRHERNLHPNLFQLSTDSPNNTPITKPTPALAAALEIQRAAAAAAATAEATKAAAGGNISTQKYRQVVMNTFIKCENGGYDYDNPEQYQPLLTRDKIEFLQANMEFLEQYQTMTCRCCNKYFNTYKNFMAHVRKKYPLLPRNLCFNCLKMNDSKALFISHLKKRNCINLYRVLNALRQKQPHAELPTAVQHQQLMTAAAAAETTSSSTTTTTTTATERPEKLRAKELLVNKLYECKLCPKGFRTKHEFRTHVYDKHADVQRKDNNSIQCSFCGLDFTDPVERRRHYNNMDCIVRLRCMTCDAKLETHQRFLDHVYQDHLGGVGSDNNTSATANNSTILDHSPGKRSLLGALGIGVSQSSSNEESRSSSNNNAGTPITSTPKPTSAAGGANAATSGGSTSSSRLDAPKSQYFSRMPQVCPICGQQYNNYNNVLRHMESKHPNKLPETYKCVRCGLGYPRISYLREHMINIHGVDKSRHSGGFEYIVNADAVKLADGSTPNVYTGRYDYVMKDLLSITNGGTLDDEEDDGGSIAKKMRLDDSSNNSSINTSIANQQKECPICNAIFSNNIGLSNHMRSHYTASTTATNAALAAANRMTPKSLTITATPPLEMVTPTAPPTPAATTTAAAAAATVSAATPTTTKAVVAPAAATPTMTVLKTTASGTAGSSGSLPPAMVHQTPQEQAVFRRSLDQAADRRFRRMRCRICQRRFSSKKSYRYHMLTDHQVQNVQFIKCKLCNAEFAYEKGLKVHLFKVHGRAIKDEMIIKQFECDVCSIVYSSELELQQHKRNVHKSHIDSMKSSKITSTATSADHLADTSGSATPATAAALPLYWYQCKYCPSNFNTNKKLAIHINSHDEFDSNDYSCKDCGNVYSGRKSLWVHRYKKHPQVPDPAECSLCRKMFFDRQMLENHTPTCNRKPITATGAHQQDQQQQLQHQQHHRGIFKHKTGDDDEEDDDDDQLLLLDDGGGEGTNITASNVSATDNALAAIAAKAKAISSTILKIRIPEVACTICGARFTDQEMFSKHIQKHEQELYVDNPLAAMFDDGPADAGQFQVERQNENGEYACDLCAKTFPQVIALKVHRKWHFRGDSKQNPIIDGEATTLNNSSSNNNNNSLNSSSMLHLRELHAVGLMPNQQQHQKQQQLQQQQQQQHQQQRQQQQRKSLKRKRELKCEYCASTFISNNNLRRHMYELHKHEVSNLPEPPVIEVDDPLMCRRCGDLKFETKELWIEHKLADAKVVRPFCPFQWGCDLCGEYLSRKEKLMNHINNHLKEDVIVPVAVSTTAKLAAKPGTATTKPATAIKTEIDTIATGKEIKVKLEREREEKEAKDEASDMQDDDDSDSDDDEEGDSTSADEDDDDEDDDDEDDDDEDDEEDEEEEVAAQRLLQRQQHNSNSNADIRNVDEEDDLIEEVLEDDGLVEQLDDGDDEDEDDEDDDDDDEEEDDDEEDGPSTAANNKNLSYDYSRTTSDKLNGNGEKTAKLSQVTVVVMHSSEDDDEDVEDEEVIEDEDEGEPMNIDDIIEEDDGVDDDDNMVGVVEDNDVDDDDEVDEVGDEDVDEDIEEDDDDDENIRNGRSSGVGDSRRGGGNSSSESESITSNSTGERRNKNKILDKKQKKIVVASAAATAADQTNSSYTCDLCQLCFDSQELLQTHIKSHFLNGPAAAVGKIGTSNSNRSSSNNNNNNNSSKNITKKPGLNAAGTTAKTTTSAIAAATKSLN